MTRPQETLRQLCEIFLSFGEWWKAEPVPPKERLPYDVYTNGRSLPTRERDWGTDALQPLSRCCSPGRQL
jgi:hypothetical protein